MTLTMRSEVGNENKRKEVQEILGGAVSLRAQAIDRLSFSFYTDTTRKQSVCEASAHLSSMQIVPELQGDPRDIAKAKCEAASKEVRRLLLSQR